MITVSDAWKDVHQRFLLPETFIEIDCTISDVGAQESATATGTVETAFSNAASVIDNTPKSSRYATNELNLWALDGTRTILSSSAPYVSAGYVSDVASTGSVTLTFPEVRTVASSGLTINWSSIYGEYPSVYTVTAKNGDTVVSEVTITDNDNPVSAAFLQLQNYDSITVTVQDWCLPYRRARIESVVVGHVLTLTKKDILSFTHEQHGDLLSGELPKTSIEFTLDNTDGRWNPNNPTGMEQYLSERQKLVVRYGMDINGVTEWIKGGVFYLSEWDAPSNGLEARFVARDSFEFLLNTELKSAVYDSLAGLVDFATRLTLPSEAGVVVDPSLNDYYTEYMSGNTGAEIIQKCANTAGCVLRYDRDGVLNIERLNRALTDYRITSALSYSHPEVTLSKPLKTVSVDYGKENPYELSVSNVGEIQTVSNDFIRDQARAAFVADWVSETLKSRKTISGEFRADPRLDLFDVVVVESKYGAFSPVVITSIKYSFTGAFRGTFTGKLLEVT
jgi:hypothetical protein